MALEIERKFLVTGSFREMALKSTRMIQGYLSSVHERTVRVRIAGNTGIITVKGISNASGTTRFEWEMEISRADAQQMLAICEPGVIDKTRYLVPAGAHTYEVDEFHGENEGLIVAEIELTAEDEAFVKPTWLGAEVTGDVRYYNSMLSKRPFASWGSGS